MRSLIALAVLLVFANSACKNKGFKDKSSSESDESSAQTDSEDARPIIPETEFVIRETTEIVSEGTVTRRPDGGIEVSGPVAGVWDKSLSPVYVASDITIGPDKILIVKAGVNVVMQAKQRISVEGGQLKIEGTPTEKVHFLAENALEGWSGIRICPDAECRQEEAKGKLEVRHAIFEGAKKDNLDPNDASWRRGGVFYIRGTATVLIEDSDFIDNYAQERGGAIELIADNRNVIFRRNRFSGNKNDGGSGGGGGALHVTHGRLLTIEDNLFTANESKGDGGAIYLLDSAGIVLKNNVFSANVAAVKGGAIRCDGHANLISIDASNKMQSNLPNDLSCDP